MCREYKIAHIVCMCEYVQIQIKFNSLIRGECFFVVANTAVVAATVAFAVQCAITAMPGK